MLFTIISFCLASLAGATIGPRQTPPSGISFNEADGARNGLPVLKLPYVTHLASQYDDSHDIYMWKNIRFAEPPTGALRWAAAQKPSPIEGVQNGSSAVAACLQAPPAELSEFLNIFDSQTQGEDCLNLDLFVPGPAVRGETTELPVMSWVFGGGYMLGSKDMSASGSPMLESADNKVIYMSMNYRVGAFGFLPGDQLNTNTSTANAGFTDQRAALQWVQDYISLVGGDPTAVTVFGESAGAGSIIHHLTALGGQSNPLFVRAVIQSPAFFPAQDSIINNNKFISFADDANCSQSSIIGSQLDCLRAADVNVLQQANIDSYNGLAAGSFPYEPSIDGKYILDRPSAEFAKGHFAPGVKLLVAHNSDEGYIFTSSNITTDEQVVNLFSSSFPNASDATMQTMLSLYPSPGVAGAAGSYQASSQFDRASNWLAESVITCNTRYAAQAYGDSYFYQFAAPPGVHAEDLVFTFFPSLSLGNITVGPFNIPLIIPTVATGFQSYITSMATSGDPNTNRAKVTLPPTMDIPVAQAGANGLNGIQVGFTGFSALDADNNTVQARCDFWQSGAAFG